jgi:hypothetical protein
VLLDFEVDGPGLSKGFTHCLIGADEDEEVEGIRDIASIGQWYPLSFWRRVKGGLGFDPDFRVYSSIELVDSPRFPSSWDLSFKPAERRKYYRRLY